MSKQKSTLEQNAELIDLLAAYPDFLTIYLA